MNQRAPNEVKRDSEVVTKKDRRQIPIFVHSALDDYGLTPIEFRAYSRIARRAGDLGACWESVPNMARDLGVSGRTLRRALRVLANACLVIETERDGETTERRITLPGEWEDKNDLAGIRKRVMPKNKKRTPDTRARGGRTPRPVEGLTSQQDPPLTPEQDEGIPSEGSHIEGNPNKEIPHTEALVIAHETETETDVCVHSSIDQENVDQEEAEPNPWDDDPWSYSDVMQHIQHCISQGLGDDIRNPIAVVKSILKNRDPNDYLAIEDSMMDLECARTAREERLAREAAARLQLEREQEERNRQAKAERVERERRQAEEDETRQQRESEEALKREQERKARAEKERTELEEVCQKLDQHNISPKILQRLRQKANVT